MTKISRRQALTWLGAAPLAVGLTGCDPRSGLPNELADEVDLASITGRVVGPSMALGHRLRTGQLPAAPEVETTLDVVIAGGGMAGLCAGRRLVAAGLQDFRLLELEDRLGGNSTFGENAVSAFPWGAHYLPEPTAESTIVRRLLRDMGLEIGRRADGRPIYDPRHLCHSPQERLFVGNRWQPGLSLRDVAEPEDAEEVAAFEAQMLYFQGYRDGSGRRAFALPMELSSRDPELLALDDISMAEDLDRRGWRSPRLRWYLDYCCRDDYGCSLAQASAWAGWHYFCSRPADAEVLTWPEGNGRLTRYLAGVLGDRARTGQMVYAAERDGGGEHPWRVSVWDARADRAYGLRCSRLIYSLPRFTAPYIVRGDRVRPEGFSYSPWLVANLVVEPPQGTGIQGRPGSRPAWDNVFFGSRSLGYVVANHQDLKVARSTEVWTYYLPLVDRRPSEARAWLQTAQWSELASAVLGDLSQAHPDIVKRVRNMDFMLWAHAMIQPLPGFIWQRRLEAIGERDDGLVFAHSDMSGMSLFEEASYRGVLAAEDVLRSLGRRVSSWQDAVGEGARPA